MARPRDFPREAGDYGPGDDPAEPSNQLHEEGQYEREVCRGREGGEELIDPDPADIGKEPPSQESGGVPTREADEDTADLWNELILRKRQWPEFTPEELQEAKERFADSIQGVRLVYNFRTNTIDAVATRNPDTWSWDIQPVEPIAADVYRETGLKLAIDAAEQLLSEGFAPATKLDDAAELAADAIDPPSVLPKLCNQAVQAVAHAHGLGFAAGAIGKVVEDFLASLITPPDSVAKAETVIQVIDVTGDVAEDSFTVAVYDFVAESVADEILKRNPGISGADLEAIEAALDDEQARTRTESLHWPEATAFFSEELE